MDVGPSRRQFLGAMGGVCATGVIASVAGGLVGAFAGALGPTGGETFLQPDVVASVGGRLDVKLVAARSMVEFGSGKRFAYTYNGTTPGPTLRVRPGDVVSITLENRLGEDTNLHTHGLHVSPSGRADNVFVHVPDGGRRTYVYEIPADHRSGTFWYHPHLHHFVAPQVFGGLAGVIIVEDALDRLPELAVAIERVLVLSDPPIGDSSSVVDVSMMEMMRGREGDVVVVNGVAEPTLTAEAGTLEHWRVLNASPSRYYRLALEGHRLTVIGTDGGRLATSFEASEVLLTPGERVEVLVAPSAAGSYRLQSLPYDRGNVGMRIGGNTASSAPTLLATMTTPVAAPPAALPSTLAPAASLALPDATASRRLLLGMGMGRGMGGGMGGRTFTIDGKTFDPTRTDITTRLGRVEEWTLTNTSTMDHPFHLHVWPFQVVTRTDGAQVTPGWKDTVNVPAGQSVVVRIPFTDIAGRTVYHCHILDHEDLGMMGVIKLT